MSRYTGGTHSYVVLDESMDEKESNDVGIIRSLLIFGQDCLESLIDQEYDFYGAESQAFKVGEHVIEVLEDPEDGYRSCLGGFLAHDESRFNFYSKPFAKVKLEEYNENEETSDWERNEFTGYHLVGTDDNHVWLTFGTDHSDDYYPRFTFSYTPKESKV